MEIKQIGKDQIGEIIKLETAAFNGQGEDIFTLAMIAEVGWVLGAFIDAGKMAGAIEILPTKKPGLGFVHGLIVEPQFQYNGVGGSLLKHAENNASEFGFTDLACTISPGNGPSLNTFINKSGYQATGFQYNYYGEGEHRLWVEKHLGSTRDAFPEEGFGRLMKSGLPEGYKHLPEDDFESMDKLINGNQWKVQGIVRPKFSGLSKNSLIISKK